MRRVTVAAAGCILLSVVDGQSGSPPCNGEHIKALLENHVDEIGAQCTTCALSHMASGGSGLFECIPDGLRCTDDDMGLWTELKSCRRLPKTEDREVCVQSAARLMTSECVGCVARAALSPEGAVCGFDPALVSNRETRFDDQVLFGCDYVVPVCGRHTPSPPPVGELAPVSIDHACSSADVRGLMTADRTAGSIPDVSLQCLGCLGGEQDKSVCIPAASTAVCGSEQLTSIMQMDQCESVTCRREKMQLVSDDCAICIVHAFMTDNGGVNTLNGMGACLEAQDSGMCNETDMLTLMQQVGEGEAVPSPQCTACLLSRASSWDTWYMCLQEGTECSAGDAQVWAQLAGCRSSDPNANPTEDEVELCLKRHTAQLSGGCGLCVTRVATQPGSLCGFDAKALFDPEGRKQEQMVDKLLTNCTAVANLCFANAPVPPALPPPAGGGGERKGVCSGSDVRSVVLDLPVEIGHECRVCLEAFDTDEVYACVNPELKCASPDNAIWAEGTGCSSWGEDAGLCAAEVSDRLTESCFACMLREALAPGAPCGVDAATFIEDESYDKLFKCQKVKEGCGVNDAGQQPVPVPIPSPVEESCDGDAMKQIVSSRFDSEKRFDRLRISETCKKCIGDSFMDPSEMYKCINKDTVCSDQDSESWTEGETCESLDIDNKECMSKFSAGISGNCHACIVRVALGPNRPCGFTPEEYFSDEYTDEKKILRCDTVKSTCLNQRPPAPSPPVVVEGSCGAVQVRTMFNKPTISSDVLGEDCSGCLSKNIKAVDNMYKCIEEGLKCSEGDAVGWAEYIKCEQINETPERAECTKQALKEVSGSCSACVLRVALSGRCKDLDAKDIVKDVFHGTDQSLFSCTAVRHQCLPQGTELTPPPLPDVPKRLVGSCSGDNVHNFVVNRVYDSNEEKDCIGCVTGSGPGGSRAYKCFDRTVLTDAVCSEADREAWRETSSCLSQEEGNNPLGRRGAALQTSENVCGVEKGLKTSGNCMACMLAVALSPDEVCEGWTPRRILSNMTDALLGILGRCQKVQQICIDRSTDHLAPVDTASVLPGTAPSGGDGKSGLGFGSIFIILLAVGLVGYCGIGVALNVANGESLPQAIPQWAFWSRGCGKCTGSPQGYLGVACAEEGIDAENDIIDVIDDAPEAGQL